MNTRQNFETIDISSISRTDLIIHYNTGQDSTTGYGKDKIHHYRSGYMTRLGDIEEEDWKQLAEALVVRENGEDELQAIIEDVSKHCVWLCTDVQRRLYALNLYMTGRRKPNG